MRYSTLGPFDDVSRLTLGGGGLGLGWGASTETEAVTTVHAALDAGINLLDTAPMYGVCESVIATALQGVMPPGVRITTKCQVGEPPVGTVAAKLEESLDASLEAMRLDRVDVYFLHSNICDDDFVYRTATISAQARDAVEPLRERGRSTFEDLQQRGRIGAWGITGIGVPDGSDPPAALPARDQARGRAGDHECARDSPGGIRRYSEAPQPRAIIAEANAHGIGVMGIRAVQAAGALHGEIGHDAESQPPRSRRLRAGHRPSGRCARSSALTPRCSRTGSALDMSGVGHRRARRKNREEPRSAS